MANYLLLRNNKESGPYSVDDLVELGLKPYDLVWVQGRSAAWRYPSEVEELKPFAPIVEEQPFDRFYKKPGAAKKDPPVMVNVSAVPNVSSVPDLSAVAEETQKQELPYVEPALEKYLPKKSVYVTMPGQKTAVARQPIKEETLPAAAIQPTITISENPAAAQIKYSQPLDEIKEMYVKTLYDRKNKIARKSIRLQSLKKGAALLSLVAVGLVAGLVIRSNTGKQAGISQTEKTSQQQPAKQEPIVTVPDTIGSSLLASSAEITQPMHQPTGGYVNKAPERKDDPSEAVQPDNKRSNDNVKKEPLSTISENKLNNSLEARGIDTDPVTGERNRKVRNENNEAGNNRNTGAEEKKPLLSDEIFQQVSVKSNDYKKVAFGGIRNLELTVTNDSKFVLDNVIVELQYIKPNELPLRTENIRFTSVGPNASSTIRVPDTNRGIKVSFRIIHIKKHQPDESVADN